MLKTSLLPVATAAVLLSGCASVASGPETQAEARTYPDSRAAVWGRILSSSAGNAMFIRQADIANGVMTVDREITPRGGQVFEENSIFNWAACGRSGVLERTVIQRVEMNYLVRQGSSGPTTVTLNGRFPRAPDEHHFAPIRVGQLYGGARTRPA